MKTAIVTLADENYLDQAKQLFSSVYFNGGWRGDYLLLAHEVSAQKVNWFLKKGIKVFHCKSLVDKIGRLPGATASRFYCFQEEFRNWDHLIYLDADIIVRSPLNCLLKINSLSAIQEHYPLRGQFTSPDQANIKLYMELENNYDLGKPSFNGGLISFPTSLIKKNTFREIVDLFNHYKSIHHFNVGEQPTLNLYFQDKWKEIPYFFNAHPVGIRQHFGLNIKKQRVLAIHFATEKPWSTNHSFYEEWSNNLEKADQIDLSRPLFIPDPWSEGKIRRHTLFFNTSRNLKKVYSKVKRFELKSQMKAFSCFERKILSNENLIDILPVPPSFKPKSHEYAGYSGPWFEQYFFRSWSKTNDKIRKKISRIYVPIFWTDYYVHSKKFEPKPEIQLFLDRNIKPEKKYFTVVQNDQGVLEKLPKNVLVFSAGGRGDVPIPLLKGFIRYRNKPKKILCSFMGNLESEKHASSVRKTLFEKLKKEKSIFFGGGSIDDFYRVTQESVFTLCPRGFGPTSFRLYEAMALGSIPIYIWNDDFWLPFSDEIDWNKIGIILPLEKIDSLIEILQSYCPEKIKETQLYIKSVFYDFFTHKGVSRWITRQLLKDEQ